MLVKNQGLATLLLKKTEHTSQAIKSISNALMTNITLTKIGLDSKFGKIVSEINSKTEQNMFIWSPLNHKFFNVQFEQSIFSFLVCLSVLYKKKKLPKIPRFVGYQIIRNFNQKYFLL